MNKKEIDECFKNIHKEENLMALQEVCESFRKSNYHNFVVALKEHLIKNELRKGGSDLVSFGRVQGINTVLDLVEFISTAEFKKEEVVEEEETNTFEFPTGYGAI